jgi:A/G-specific adenine glycosylase
MPSPAALKTCHRQLHAWYQQHGRKDLPWRNTTDAYAIYVSETMLQQTQVKTVLERFYHPFLKRFPTLSHLAKSDSDAVLQAWQGLGYYSRALNMQKAAQQCQGTLPDNAEALMALPGIGRNTAHAICSFAHHQPMPVMEANVKRVLCRVFALTDPKDKELWEKADHLLDTANPFDYNQAMMDIGAMVCLKRNPLCKSCPLESICKGRDSPESYPAAKVKKSVPVRYKHIAVLVNHKGQYHAAPRSSRFLHGMYHFIEVDQNNESITYQGKHIALDNGKPIGHVRQQYSHFTLEADVWLIPARDHGNSWYDFAALRQLPMSMAETKILALIEQAKPANPKTLT